MEWNFAQWIEHLQPFLNLSLRHSESKEANDGRQVWPKFIKWLLSGRQFLLLFIVRATLFSRYPHFSDLETEGTREISLPKSHLETKSNWNAPQKPHSVFVSTSTFFCCYTHSQTWFAAEMCVTTPSWWGSAYLPVMLPADAVYVLSHRNDSFEIN